MKQPEARLVGGPHDGKTVPLSGQVCLVRGIRNHDVIQGLYTWDKDESGYLGIWRGWLTEKAPPDVPVVVEEQRASNS